MKHSFPVEYLVYKNSFLRGVLPVQGEFAQNHPEKLDQLPVLVTWGSGFSQTVGWGLWKSRNFLEEPKQSRFLTDPKDKDQAEIFFERAFSKLEAVPKEQSSRFRP